MNIISEALQQMTQHLSHWLFGYPLARQQAHDWQRTEPPKPAVTQAITPVPQSLNKLTNYKAGQVTRKYHQEYELQLNAAMLPKKIHLIPSMDNPITPIPETLQRTTGILPARDIVLANTPRAELFADVGNTLTLWEDEDDEDTLKRPVSRNTDAIKSTLQIPALEKLAYIAEAVQTTDEMEPVKNFLL